MTLRPSWTHLDEVLAEAARWLTSNDQPKDAIMNHWGESAHAGGGLNITFAPNTNRSVTIICSQGRDIDLSDIPYDQWDQFPKAIPFTADEIDSLAQALTAHGLQPIDQWNGAGFDSGSFRTPVRTCAPSVARAIENYHKGCPVHKHVFCGTWQAGQHNGEKECRHMPDGYDRVIPAAFPEVGLPAPAMPEAARSDRNLEIVLRAIARGASTIERMGHHVATVVPGVRGEADDASDFVETGGYGVTIPAELYDQLIDVARAWDELGLDR